jgi:hypothetical protein
MNAQSPLSHTVGHVPGQARPPQKSSNMSPRILWIDGVGGYLLLDRDDLLLGQAGSVVDIGIVGDISRQAALIHRRQSDYFLEPMQETLVNGSLISEVQLLHSPVEFQIGNRVKLRFIKPHPLSSTARLELASMHRFMPRVDGVLLLADSCILGPSDTCHVRCAEWSRDLLMFRQGDQWFFRPSEAVMLNGQTERDQFPLVPGMRLNGNDFSLSVE